MMYAIINRDMDWVGQIMNPTARAVYGPFASREEAEKYNSLFPSPGYNLIVRFHGVEGD